MEKTKQKSYLGIYLLRLFRLFQGQRNSNKKSKFFRPFFFMHLGRCKNPLKKPNDNKNQKPKNEGRGDRND